MIKTSFSPSLSCLLSLLNQGNKEICCKYFLIVNKDPSTSETEIQQRARPGFLFIQLTREYSAVL